METGKINHVKTGPVFWIDCADSQPCLGTAGSLTWFLKAASCPPPRWLLQILSMCSRQFCTFPPDPDRRNPRPHPLVQARTRPQATGKLFHSGLPHKGVNSLELANTAMAEIQNRFYRDFPGTDKEAAYKFISPSTMKPTQVIIRASRPHGPTNAHA
jgi:acetylornithine deacetylase